jgi:dedicator of cytokinesis protein 9/10/11
LEKSQPLSEEIYELDTEFYKCQEEKRTQEDLIFKQGYLLKGTDTISDKILVNINSRAFKKRHCCLRQELDGTFVLEIHKDEKHCDNKTIVICLEFCTAVNATPKRGPRYCFEMKVSQPEQKSILFAAESEAEMEDWIKKITSAMQQNELKENNSLTSQEKVPLFDPALCGTLKGLEQSINSKLAKYNRETSSSISQARKADRKRIFQIIQSGMSRQKSELQSVEPFKSVSGEKILIKCEELKFRLQLLTEDSQKAFQLEPYITSVALFDAKIGKKLTENFYFDLNDAQSRRVLNCADFSLNESTELYEQYGNTNNNEAIFNVTVPHSDVFIVIRIEKILQGNIQQICEPYIKAHKDSKASIKLAKLVKQYIQKIGHFRMPFAWTARPLFRLYSNELDTESDFPGIFRQDANKIKDEDILKILKDFRKSEKLQKIPIIPGNVRISVRSLSEISTVHPTDKTPEIFEFCYNSEKDLHPYTKFINNLYIYPISLNFETQKFFSRARNIAITIEYRNSDSQDAQPLEVNCKFSVG